MRTPVDFPSIIEQIVYVKQVPVETLPQDVQDQAEGFDHLFAVHNANGEQLALVTEKHMAFALARQNDMAPVTVH